MGEVTVTQGLYEPDDFGPLGDSARRIASYCEGEARANVYKAAKQELARTNNHAELVEALREALSKAVKWLAISDDPRCEKDLHAAEAALSLYGEGGK